MSGCVQTPELQVDGRAVDSDGVHDKGDADVAEDRVARGLRRRAAALVHERGLGAVARVAHQEDLVRAARRRRRALCLGCRCRCSHRRLPSLSLFFPFSPVVKSVSRFL